MTVCDRGYDDRDIYTSTPDAAAASASYHRTAVADDEALTRVEVAAELRDEERAAARRRWRR